MYNNKQNPDKWTLPFMAWELRLYLDTHPDDAKALAAYKQVCATLDACAGACGALSGDQNAAHFSWVDDPWPWQAEANMTDLPAMKNESEG